MFPFIFPKYAQGIHINKLLLIFLLLTYLLLHLPHQERLEGWRKSYFFLSYNGKRGSWERSHVKCWRCDPAGEVTGAPQLHGWDEGCLGVAGAGEGSYKGRQDLIVNHVHKPRGLNAILKAMGTSIDATRQLHL